jgi:hypothetical protein
VNNGLKQGRFREISEEPSHASGFASWDDLFDTEFTYSSYHKAEYVAFQFRVDRRRIPSILRKQHVRAAIDRYREENEGRWPSRQEKAQIRDDVLVRLLDKVLPHPTGCDLAWNTKKKWLLAGTTSKTMLDMAFGHLESHLRIYPAPLLHSSWAQRLLPARGPERAALDSLVSPDSGNALAEGRVLGYEFLTWLWFRSETEGGATVLPDGREAEIHVGERIVLSRPDDGRERVLCTTPAVSLHEARTALQHGKQVEDVQLITVLGDNEYSFRLDRDLWSVRSFRGPRQIRDPGEEERDGIFLEKMFFLEEVFAALDAAYALFLSQRLTGGWESKGKPAMKKWLESGDP